MHYSSAALSYVATSMHIAQTSIGNDALIPHLWSWSSEENFSTCFNSTIQSRSPWFALRQAGIDILIPSNFWPEIMEMHFSDISLCPHTNFDSLWDISTSIVVRVSCPFCCTIADYPLDLPTHPYQGVFDALTCRKCELPIWPFSSSYSVESQVLPSNIVTL